MDPSSADQDLCHQGAVQCDKQGRITDLVLQVGGVEAEGGRREGRGLCLSVLSLLAFSLSPVVCLCCSCSQLHVDFL